MIIDKLDNLEKYAALNPLFPKVVEFLKANDLNKMADGKYEIEGQDLFVNITTTKGKTPDEAVLEAHNRMIDIQIPLTATETYGYTHRSLLPQTEFDEEKDSQCGSRQLCDLPDWYDGYLLSARRSCTLYCRSPRIQESYI